VPMARMKRLVLSSVAISLCFISVMGITFAIFREGVFVMATG
jgi:hypothetical protein